MASDPQTSHLSRKRDHVVKQKGALRPTADQHEHLYRVLVRNQSTLGLDNTDVVVLLNVVMLWWEKAGEMSFSPRPSVIARRMGVNVRTIQRHLRHLRVKDLLKHLPWGRASQAFASHQFDPSEFVKEMEEFVENRRRLPPGGSLVGAPGFFGCKVSLTHRGDSH
jgi:hypothetical protein